MRNALCSTALLLAAASVVSYTQEAHAQRGEKVLIIYGNDPCPTSNGEEIVVCARKPEGERYRIPEELRESAINKRDERWADRAASIEYAGRSGISSCSPTGAGGATGCFNQMIRKARAENKEKGEEPAVKF